MKPNFQISILLIDDDAMVKGILVEYLQDIGFTHITVAKNPQHALRLVQDKRFRCDLVISDWEMPQVNGLTLLKAVRKNPKRSSTPFLMITSQRSLERFKITQAGQWMVSAYLLKPFRASAFKEKIWEALGWEKQVDEAS